MPRKCWQWRGTSFCHYLLSKMSAITNVLLFLYFKSQISTHMLTEFTLEQCESSRYSLQVENHMLRTEYLPWMCKALGLTTNIGGEGVKILLWLLPKFNYRHLIVSVKDWFQDSSILMRVQMYIYPKFAYSQFFVPLGFTPVDSTIWSWWVWMHWIWKARCILIKKISV